METDEVILRRTVGQRKEVFKINDKTVTKKEVLDHLETYETDSNENKFLILSGIWFLGLAFLDRIRIILCNRGK